MSTRESLPSTKCDSYLNQSLTNVPSILSHFSSSNASVFDRIVRSEERSAGMPRPNSYAVLCLKNKLIWNHRDPTHPLHQELNELLEPLRAGAPGQKDW